MNFWSLATRVVARIRGTTVVMVGALVAFVMFAPLSVDTWQKIVGFIILGLVLLAAAYRLVISPEEGTIDLEVSEGQRRLVINNIPPRIAAGILTGGLRIYGRRHPLPRPVGVVTGIPARAADVKLLADVELPEDAEVTDQPLTVPDDAVSLQIAVNDQLALGLSEQAKAEIQESG